MVFVFRQCDCTVKSNTCNGSAMSPLFKVSVHVCMIPLQVLLELFHRSEIFPRECIGPCQVSCFKIVLLLVLDLYGVFLSVSINSG